MSWTAERARVASLSRSRPADDPDLIQARGNLKAERLAAHLEKAVAADPPLTGDQRSRLAAILMGDALDAFAERVCADAPPLTTAQVDRCVAVLRGSRHE